MILLPYFKLYHIIMIKKTWGIVALCSADLELFLRTVADGFCVNFSMFLGQNLTKNYKFQKSGFMVPCRMDRTIDKIIIRSYLLRTATEDGFFVHFSMFLGQNLTKKLKFQNSGVVVPSRMFRTIDKIIIMSYLWKQRKKMDFTYIFICFCVKIWAKILNFTILSLWCSLEWLGQLIKWLLGHTFENCVRRWLFRQFFNVFGSKFAQKFKMSKFRLCGAL